MVTTFGIHNLHDHPLISVALRKALKDIVASSVCFQKSAMLYCQSGFVVHANHVVYTQFALETVRGAGDICLVMIYSQNYSIHMYGISSNLTLLA